MKSVTVFALRAPLAAVAFFAVGMPSTVFAQAYVGSEACAACHLSYYNDFRVSGHPFKLAPVDEARHRPIPLPEGVRWEDISYVIGGFKWKTRYMGLDGYIITTLPSGTNGMNQYNMLTDAWSNYNPGQTLPYNCGSCHTTGYSTSGNQDGLPGIVGTWAAPGVQCEACHGPGENHVATSGSAPLLVDSTAAACGACHLRGNKDTIPASGGFIRHHEQWNELRASPHRFLECTDCHNPHKRSEFSIERSCADCHQAIAAGYAQTAKAQRGIRCEDCHMPMASLSAQSLGPHQGDLMTHLFRINTDPSASLFNANGTFVQLDANGQAGVTLNFACLRCHQDQEARRGLQKALQWAGKRAVKFHQRKFGGGVKSR